MNPPQGGAGTNVVVPLISMLGCAIECANYTNIEKKCELYFDWQDMQVGVQAQVVWRGVGKLGLKFHSVGRSPLTRLQPWPGKKPHRRTLPRIPRFTPCGRRSPRRLRVRRRPSPPTVRWPNTRADGFPVMSANFPPICRTPQQESLRASL